MIFDKNETEVKSLGFESGGKMSVQNKNLSKVFKLLTTSTYKSIEESVLREICSNAVDAQVMAGKKDEPIYLTYKDNCISIKDNGIGMSDHFVNNEYMSLGESTKENNEDQIGSFGIGRASVFAYTKYYTLISRYDGVISTYLIAETEDGLPDVTLLSADPTEECNGVEVKFELIKHKDYEIFKSAATNQLKYFRNIIIEGFNIDNDFKLIQGDNFIYRPDRVNSSGQLEVVWHNVRYPIDFNYLGIPPIHVNCGLYFPQNTPFKPEAARENLRNTESNKKLILEKIEKLRNEFYNLWKKEQDVDDFIVYINKKSKTITFENVELSVGDVIKEEYIYTPLSKTSIDPKEFKSSCSYIYEKLFIHRKNSRFWSNSLFYIGVNDKIFHSEKTVGNEKLSKNSWQAFIRPSEASYENLAQYIYKDIKFSYVNGEQLLLNPRNINYEEEISFLRNCIWEDIKERTIDINTLTVKKVRVKNKIGKSEVRVKIFDKAFDTYNTDFFKDHKIIVYTTDTEEFKLIRNFPEKFKSINTFFIPVFGSKKYEGKIPRAITFEEFFKSRFLKKLYFKGMKNTIIYNKGMSPFKINPYLNLHPMYRNKYKNLSSEISKQIMYSIIPTDLRRKLGEIYSDESIVKEIDKLSSQYNSLISTPTHNDKENIKYLRLNLLYKAYKKKTQYLLNKIKNES